MAIVGQMLVPLNFILTTALTSIIVFDRHDEEQRKFIKTIWFLLGGTGIVYFYKFSNLGNLFDETLESDVFETVFSHKLT